MNVLDPQPGDHLRVRRGLYSHHGVYLGNGKVVDFSGGTISEKFQTSVREVTLHDFARCGTVKVVAHPSKFLCGLGVGLPPAVSPDETVHHARRMAKNCPPGRYHLLGANCEHVANSCVTGGYFESLQARRAFFLTSIGNLALLVWTHRAGVSRQRLVALGLVALAECLGPVLYNFVPYRRSDLLRTHPGYTGNGNGLDDGEGAST